MKTFNLWSFFIEGYKSGMDIGLTYGGTVEVTLFTDVELVFHY
jgi:hypothetical protein